MKKQLVWTGLLVLVLSLGTWAGNQATLVGKVIDIDGPVLMTNRMTEDRWFQGYMEMPAFLRERLRADDKTTATIQFYVGGRAVISPGSEVEIVTKESLQTLFLKSGKVWAQFEEQDKEFQIQTAGGVLGIEGTEFFVEADSEGETTVSVVEGKVRVRSGDDEQVVTDGEEAVYRRGVRRYQRFANFAGLTMKQRRLEAFKKLTGQNALFQQYVLTRGLSKRSRRQLGKRFYRRRALGSLLTRMPSQAPARRPARRNEFDLKSVEMLRGRPQASWTPYPCRSYAVVVSTDPEAEDILWAGQSPRSDFTYPDYGPELESGVEYYVSVAPLRRDETPFQERDGDIVAAQSTFRSTGHLPSYAMITGLKVDHNPEGLPICRWDGLAGADSYLVSMSDDSGPVWTEETEEIGYQYPLAARALSPGTYRVVVEAFDDSGVKMAESAPATFTTEGWQATGLEGPARE